jgi:hypothetical protein
MLNVVGEIVKQRIAEPAANEHTQGSPNDHVIDLILGHGQSLVTNLPRDQEVGGGEPDKIHQAVPPEL